MEYDQLVNLLISSLAKRILKFYNNEACNEQAFTTLLTRVMSNLRALE